MHLEVVAHAKPCREKGKMVCVLEPRECGSGWDQRCWLGQGQARRSSWDKRAHRAMRKLIPPSWGGWVAWVGSGSEVPVGGGGSCPRLFSGLSPPSQVSLL